MTTQLKWFMLVWGLITCIHYPGKSENKYFFYKMLMLLNYYNLLATKTFTSTLQTRLPVCTLDKISGMPDHTEITVHYIKKSPLYQEK